jgi:hypothetical protein
VARAASGKYGVGKTVVLAVADDVAAVAAAAGVVVSDRGQQKSGDV